MAEITREPIRAEAAGEMRILHLEGQVTVSSAIPGSSSSWSRT